MVLTMPSEQLNPVVVMERLPESVVDSLRRISGQDGVSPSTNRGSLPEDIIKPDTEHSQPDKPPTMLRIDGLLLGPGYCRTMDVWLQEPELDMDSASDTERPAAPRHRSSRLFPMARKHPNIKSIKGVKSMATCPSRKCGYRGSYLADHLRNFHKYSRNAIKDALYRSRLK